MTELDETVVATAGGEPTVAIARELAVSPYSAAPTAAVEPPTPWATESRQSRFRAALPWCGEALFLVVGYFLYGLTRGAAPGRHAQALETGHALWAAERALGIDWEVPLNAWLTAHPSLASASTGYYGSFHFVLTPLLLVLVAWRARALWVRVRTAIVVTTALALIGYWVVPTSPPRLLGPPFVDTLGVLAGPVSALANVDAALPSLHVGWATWCAFVGWALLGPTAGVGRRRRWGVRAGRLLWVGYPVLTTIVVLATANHYLLDAVAGAAIAAVGWWVGQRVGAAVDARAARRNSRDARRNTRGARPVEAPSAARFPVPRRPAPVETDTPADAPTEGAPRAVRRP